MKRIPDSLSPAEAWARMANATPLQTQVLSLENAIGHHLAEDITVPEDVPSGNRSFMDGFAVRAIDVSSPPVRLQVAGEILMGRLSADSIGEGQAVFIPTGGFLPAGADAVVMQEDTVREGNSVVIHRKVASMENVQRQAEDFFKGELIFRKSHRLRPQDLSALGTFGIQSVSVITKPQIAVVSTGNELVDFHRTPGAAQIRETNSLALLTAARQFFFDGHSIGIIPDEIDAQRAAMTRALKVADVVLISGGSSVGERDYTLEVIRTFPEHQVHYHGIAIRPGNPTIFASIGDKWVFGLPGQPVSSLMVFYHFVLPFLFHLAGDQVDDSNFVETRFRSVSAILQEEIKPLKLKTDYVRLRLERSRNEWRAYPVPGKSASLSTLALADAFAIVPPGETPLPKNTAIKAFLFP